MRTLGRAACCSRLLREHCYAPHLYGAAKVGLALQRRFPRPRTLGEARFLCAPEPRKGGPRAPRAPGDAVRAPLASFVLGCTGSSVVEDEDDFEGFAANRAWLDAKRRYRAHVVRSQRCLRALRDTGRLPPGIEVCYVSSVHDGAFVSRVSFGAPSIALLLPSDASGLRAALIYMHGLPRRYHVSPLSARNRAAKREPPTASHSADELR